MKYTVGDLIRVKKEHKTGYRVWLVSGVYLGALGQESCYGLTVLDLEGNGELRVPCALIDMATSIRRMSW